MRLEISMNRNQKICLTIGFLLLIVAALFPPWRVGYSSGGSGLPELPKLPGLGGSRSYSSSFGFLFKPPPGPASIELSRLIVEWTLISLLASGLFLWFKDRAAVSPQMACGFFTLKHPSVGPTVVCVDDQGNVDAWVDGQSTRVGTWKALEANGAKLSAAADEEIAKHVGQQYKQDARAAVLTRMTWTRREKWRLLVSVGILFGICVLGLSYSLATKNIARELPPSEVVHVSGLARITDYGAMELNAYNGSDRVLTEITVSVSVFDASGNTVISGRAYRLFPAYGLELNPQSSGKFSADLGFTLDQGQIWRFTIIGAKGRRE